MSFAVCLRNFFNQKQAWFSIEVMPPKSLTDAKLLIDQLQPISTAGPLFCDVTMHNFLACFDKSKSSSLSLAADLKTRLKCEIILHLTCDGHSKTDYKSLLQEATVCGIKSLFIVRGDNFESLQQSDRKPCFQYASDLVQFVQQHFGDKFCIGVAGYPSGTREEESVEDSIQWLKLKVQLGAQFVLTQAVYTECEFKKFVQLCKQNEITVPIIAGLLPIKSYKTFQMIQKLGRIHIPVELEQQIEVHKDNDQIIADISLKYCAHVAQEIITSGSTYCVHLFTLNNLDHTLKLISLTNEFKGLRPKFNSHE